jgi:hypothetical protein
LSHFIVTRGIIGSGSRIFGTDFSRFSKLEVQALVTANLERAVDKARMRQITGGHAADMTKLLQTLVAKGTLTQEGQGRWTRYRLPVIDHSLLSFCPETLTV